MKYYIENILCLESDEQKVGIKLFQKIGDTHSYTTVKRTREFGNEAMGATESKE